MITAALFMPGHMATEEDHETTRLVRSLLATRASVIEVEVDNAFDSMLSNLPIDVAVLQGTHLTPQMADTLNRLQATHPTCVSICVASEDMAVRAQAEAVLKPTYWVILPASSVQIQSQLDTIFAMVGNGGVTLQSPSATLSLAGRSNNHLSAAALQHGLTRVESALYRTVGRLTGSFDTEQLFSAYCEAIHEMTGCVSYALLWQMPREREFHIIRSEGLAPVVSDICRLSPTDPLPTWLQRNRGILLRDTLLDYHDAGPVIREVDLCGGTLVVPLFCQGNLRGMMIVGPKVIGMPYVSAEAEALFVLSANAASAVRQAELHTELEARNDYIDKIILSMQSGIVTINLEARICVCNPYAIDVLRLRRENVIGSDLRLLPSPLGDFLYSCLTYGEERTHEEIPILGNRVVVRASTRRLMSPDGGLMGSMLAIEDTTAERALAEERRKLERNEVISQVVARFAHEVKNPLATIHTFAELLPTRVDDPEFQSFWSEHVRHDVHRLNDLVGKMVSLSEQPLSRREPVAVTELLRMSVERITLLDQNFNVDVLAGINDNLPMVNVDANCMAAAISHLVRYVVGNCKGAVRVETCLQDGPLGEQPVAIYIKASGNNHKDINPQKLLDPSYVLDHPDIDLGPSASQRIVESQGGALDAYTEGQDIVFRISLIPFLDTPAAVKKQEKAK